MATFDFSVPTGTFTRNVNGTSTWNFLDTPENVTFTLSIVNGDGDNDLLYGYGSIRYGISHGTNSSLQDILVLDVIGAGETRFDGAISFDVARVIGSWTVNGQALVTGANTFTGPVSAFTFKNLSGVDGEEFTINSLTATINCFCAGTCIATPEGPRAVEDLVPGDTVLTADGSETTVKWLGEQPVNVRLSHPRKVNPIRIRAGALATGIPARDLYLSQDHAIALDGCLVNAGALVNGVSITQVRDMPLEGFSYYHVETDAHELLLAEGVAAESFIDYAGRDSFLGAPQDDAATIAEMDLPRISAARLVPDAIVARLTARGAAMEEANAA